MSKSLADNPFITEMKDKNGDSWYHQIILELKDKEIERLNNIINDIDRYIHNWKLEDIGEKTMLILNDILLIKNGMSDEVIRLKGSDKVE